MHPTKDSSPTKFFLNSLKFSYFFSPCIRSRVCTLLCSYSASEQNFLSFFYLLYMERENPEAKNSPRRGNVKAQMCKTLAKGVKAAATVAAKKVGCIENSAPTAPQPSSDNSEGH
ncbi:hypothetical protein I3842_02G174800 [Carya illinoinensis]|uniref:Uncharacterized protein n=1 Tax=Carya illinoinensis TaxID=32201 RepID=A0A922FXB7_CARIL|nr:hypothetical protein I3842_02G174800 [Carya illinoinensis]